MDHRAAGLRPFGHGEELLVVGFCGAPRRGAAPVIQSADDDRDVANTGRKGEQRVTRVLAISDSDSYLKWSVATLRALPAAWSSTQLVVKNPVLPSAEQARTAAGAPVPVLAYPALLRRLERERPDVVLLAASGPVVAALTAAPVLRAAGPSGAGQRPARDQRAGHPAGHHPAGRLRRVPAAQPPRDRRVHRAGRRARRAAHASGWPRCRSSRPARRPPPTRRRTDRWCSPPRPRCRYAGRTGSRSCWPWPRPARRWSSSGP